MSADPPIPWQDTIIAYHSFASHLPKKLDFAVTALGADAAPWKIQHGRRGGDDEKGALSRIDESSDGHELCRYNASDCRLTSRLWGRLQANPATRSEARTYAHDMALAEVCRQMYVQGIGVDRARRDALATACRIREAALLAEMRTALDWPDFAPSKLAHVREALFTRLGARWTLATSTGIASTSDAALEALQGPEGRTGDVTRALLAWRKTGKIRATYLDALELWPSTAGGDRVHFGWKSFGTVSGRLASRFQSIPRYVPASKGGNPEDAVREIYIPRPGHVFVYFDVAQAEMRAAASLSGDGRFIAATQRDIHAENAKVCFPALAAQGFFDGKEAKEGRGKKYRDILKNFGFAISYCAEAEKLWMTLVRKGFRVRMQDVAVQLANLRAAYATYFRWVAANHAAVQRCGHMRSPHLGRIRWLGWHPPITDVANYPIQSFIADVVNERTVALWERLRLAPVAQVHDACIYDVPAADAPAVADEIRTIWEKPIALANGRMLVLPIELKAGDRWSEL